MNKRNKSNSKLQSLVKLAMPLLLFLAFSNAAISNEFEEVNTLISIAKQNASPVNQLAIYSFSLPCIMAVKLADNAVLAEVFKAITVSWFILFLCGPRIPNLGVPQLSFGWMPYWVQLLLEWVKPIRGSTS
ncbi:hypothetical protein [Shewanella algae]|uniref:hypothetical protein n=1 Tax=Shewanella algae TaxID=38313 RepID=UPI00046A9CE1|nr:hypothetical protein [Shewanella algae]NKZ41386.1 hypothetical protein [Shewanella algae]QTE78702.1 hypothetical protein E1N14_003310 [Shewanella algae]